MALTPLKLFDEIEEEKLQRVENYQRCKHLLVGLQLSTTVSLDCAKHVVITNSYNFLCCSLVNEANFISLINKFDKTKDGKETWHSIMFPRLNGTVVKSSTVPVESDHKMIIGALSTLKPDLDIQDEKKTLRTILLLKCQMEYYISLRMEFVLFEVMNTSVEITNMVLSLLNLTSIGRYSAHHCRLILKFDLRPASYGFLNWLHTFRNRANEEATRFFPTLRLQFELPGNEDIEPWLTEDLKFLFIPTDIFILRKNSIGDEVPCLPASHRATVIKFLEAGVSPVVESNGQGNDLKGYRGYIYHIWVTHLSRKKC